jgi:signal transduction histidine kinase/CRP-like cAMP-binding protein
MQTSSSSFPRIQSEWLLGLVAVAALVLSGALLVVYGYAALSWYNQPFLGILPLRTLQVSPNESLTGGEWPALRIGMQPGDQIDRLDGIDLGTLPVSERLEKFRQILSAHQPGDRMSISFLRGASVSGKPLAAQCMDEPGEPGLRRCGMQVWLNTMPTGDLIAYFGVGWISGLVLWLVTALLLLRQAGNPQVRLITIVSAVIVVFLAGRFDTISTHEAGWVWLLLTCLGAGLLVVVAMEFPYRFAFVQQMPLLGWAPMIVALALGGASAALYFSSDTNLSQAAFVLALGTLILGALILVGTMIWRRTRSASPIVRNQSTIVIIGLIPMLLPLGLWFGSLVVGDHPLAGLVTFNQVFPVLFPFSMMYAVLQFRLVDTDRVITQTFLYGALLALMTVTYWLIVAGVAALIGRSMRDTALSPVLIIGSIFLVAVAFTPLRVFLQRLIDAVYFRARHAYQGYLEQFTREVTNAVSLHDVSNLLQKTLDDALAPTHAILFVRDIVSYGYQPLPDPVTGQPSTDVQFASESGLVRYLRDRADLLYLEEGRPLPLDVVSDRARLAVLGAPIVVGLRGQRALNGFLAIGPRKGGAPYLHEDLRFIESLSDQIALAVERAQAVDDLERRVRVQDVLSQVSRALNFAIDFDTLLELIYAQTMRVIDAPCFYIALRNPNTDELYYVFYNEGDERIAEQEGKRWRMGRDLISEIARTQQTIRTDDYVRESLQRDPHTPPDNPNLEAWMGVPLMADTGGGVLGVMIAATNQPGTAFNDEQQDLFWDIANLAASAIDKLQLFEKTQQRARQLAAINQISNQLASEMGNVDRLLRLITENAVQILDAEAGSLLLVDEDTSDLEFRVVVGGAGQELLGTRLPAGTGLAGATVQRGTPIIVNDPSRDSRWFGDIRTGADHEAIPIREDGRDGGSGGDGSDGFRSGAILSVPLLVSGRAIGVLQILNKHDGSIFISEDADLITTFAGQAAIAIENARLFDMTDQQLALRVQELDTMQRIDQELNRTLDLRKVVDITMDWALRKSGGSAGALFIRDRERGELRGVASYGYPRGTPFYYTGELQVYPEDRGVIGRVVRTAQPSLITDVSMDPDYEETLPDCVAQLTVPLFSANRVIGVIILESNEEGELDLLDLDFVARLAEHASPAIVNSQLFQELQRANEAKSEFVSFVAHELKNPMTSMKGYTDLLMKGVVGPVNEQQGDFLRTIYSNVNRMETLVSDLNDLTKQQTNNLRLDLMSVNFRNVVLETLRAQQRLIAEKNQELVIEVPETLPLVRGDQNRLIQIMTNFVSNANKYTPPGGRIRIRAEASRNVWDPQGVPEVIHCYVRDTGIGMSEDDLKRLFTPYFRSDNPKTREQPGTGLGLSITKGLIELHGGRIWVETEPEAGTTFHFTVPVATEQEGARARV